MTRVIVAKRLIATPPAPTPDRDTRWSIKGTQPPLPDWLEIRDVQIDAMERCVKEFDAGARVVQLDAPTGVGKTIIAELVRREMQVERGLYVCTTKSLQDQVARDFEYARMLKGRANYTPTKVSVRGQGWSTGGMTISCQDCDAGPRGQPASEQSCTYCEWVEHCPYTTAKSAAMFAPVGVLNTAYLLAYCNHTRPDPRGYDFHGRGLVVADEADLLEDELLGYVEVRVAKKVLDRLGLEVPKKGSHMTTIRAWLAEEVEPKLVDERAGLAKQHDLEGRREHARVDRLIEDVKRVIAREEGWVRDGDEEGKRDSLVLKPVSVEDVADRYLWRHGENWLLMSGTTVSAEGQADILGLEKAGIEWASVEVGAQFDKERRRVVFVPVGLMTKKGQEAGGTAKVLRGIEKVLERHPGVNVLIHTHTYLLAKEVTRHVKEVDDRPVITYERAGDRDRALDLFKRAAREGGGILVASSMDRGVDLPGDLCRVMVIAKVPMASLGSRQVSERKRRPGGDAWYLMGTVRTLMQMCGRGVRSMDDECVTYVLDEFFGKVLKDGKRMGMWPEWWLEALEVGRVREYV